MEEENQYENSSECEDYTDYGPDGYHPVALGEKFNHKYTVIQKLGWGHFSTVWLVYNCNNMQYSALKIQRSKENHAESALDQLQLLSQIRKYQNQQKWRKFLEQLEKKQPKLINAKLCQPLQLLDNFTHYGIFGKHYCSVFQILGPNLLDVIQHFQFKYQRMFLDLVKKITRDILIGLIYLHQYCGIIHTDLKPQNIMIKLEKEQQLELLQHIKTYTIKPISMKFLKNLQSTKNKRNKKKKDKKKIKKIVQSDKIETIQNKQQKDDSELKKCQIIKQKQIENILQIQQDQRKQNKNEQKIQHEQQNLKDIQLPSINGQETISNQAVEKVIENSIPNKQAIMQQQNQSKKDVHTLKWKNVKIDLNSKRIFFKIVDMGNACFTLHHFTEDIQTREYRSPEVILGHQYKPNTDIWSLACIVFEMLTNNFLFKPKHISGISKNEDHLYKMMQILGPISKDYIANGSENKKYFNKKCKLFNGNPKQTLSLSQLLTEDYSYHLEDAKQIEEFLLPMLKYEPSNRINANQCLKNPWLWK